MENSECGGAEVKPISNIEGELQIIREADLGSKFRANKKRGTHVDSPYIRCHHLLTLAS